MSDFGSVFQQEAAVPSSPASVEEGSHAVALAAAAVVAVAGGLVWAGVVIATRFDIGILAWFVGAAAGLAAVRLAGSGLAVAERVAIGALAAGGILVGRYVIFVHDLKVELGKTFPGGGVSVGYLDSRVLHVFIHDFTDIVKPIYIVWIALSFFAALRAAGGRRVLPRAR